MLMCNFFLKFEAGILLIIYLYARFLFSYYRLRCHRFELFLICINIKKFVQSYINYLYLFNIEIK